MLREGSELHRDTATALAYIADPSSIAPLVQHIQTDKGPTRHEAVRALGATQRVKRDPAARKLLRQLAQEGSIKVSLAAVAGIAAARDPADAPLLRKMVGEASSDRRRAAAAALGAFRDAGSIDVLAGALSGKDDRLIADSAWSLGEILVANPTDARAGAVADRLLYLGKQGGWAAAIDATGALARVLWALPREGRTGLLTGTRRAALLALGYHRSRLVRINVAHALGSLPGDDDAAKVLAQLLRDDQSPQVRIAAARNLGRVSGAKAVAALKIADGDPNPLVKEAVKAARAQVPPPVARSEWRVFYVVDPAADDAPVRQEQYFVHTADGLVWASYTDARGYLTSEFVPPGDTTVTAASRESEY